MCPDGGMDESSKSTAAFPSGGVLVVDDEDYLRELCIAVLESEGLRTFGAPSGEHALETYRGNQSDIHLVLLDLKMPGLSGADTLKELRMINPEVRVIVLSGMSTRDPEDMRRELQCDAFLPKPFEIDTLLQEVARLLPA